MLQSATIVEDGVTTTATYSYNAEGQRIKKVVGDSVTNYYYNGDILAGMTIDGMSLTFRYDENGVPFSFTYGESEYFYVRNLQGDVAYIVNDFGSIMGYYTYDAWGNVTEIYGSIAELNPIRYRGYVYDNETGYYYLNSRYYDPELCRFISADGYVSTGQGMFGFNMFAYCLNNPINYLDYNGTAASKATVTKKSKKGATTTISKSIVTAISKSAITPVASTYSKIDAEIQKVYTVDAAKKEINKILDGYTQSGKDCYVTIDTSENGYFEIENSYLVDSSYDRQKICLIMERTGLTDRQYDDMAAEWCVHNFAYQCIPWFKENGRSAKIDFLGDSRWYVGFATDFFEIMGWL